ncbi:MAG: hypothetical protein HWE30_07560 [Methylocystaceae bacterium]|nr:hypothetical protein [Methylocystaceae bacterium]
MTKYQEQVITRKLISAVLLLPFLLFSFYSVGTMVQIGPKGIKTVICSGTSIQTIYVDENGQPVEQKRLKVCDFASQLQAMNLLSLPLAIGVALTFSPFVYFSIYQTRVSVAHPFHFFARAPPFSI